jgi:hypothetical protein
MALALEISLVLSHIQVELDKTYIHPKCQRHHDQYQPQIPHNPICIDAQTVHVKGHPHHVLINGSEGKQKQKQIIGLE